jgi:hypothetical protein
MSREVFTHQNRYLPNTSFYSHIKTQSKMHIVLFLSVGTSPSLVTCCSMADASDRAFTCVSGAVAERFFVYMARRTRISSQFLFLCNVMPDRMVL